MTLHTIVDNDMRMLIPFPCRDKGAQYSWGGDNLLCVISQDENSDDAFRNFLLDVRTGKTIPAPAQTPSASTTKASKP
jgi:hypothetical protein